MSTRVGLKRVCLLIDTKWGMKPRDYELINLMERYMLIPFDFDLSIPNCLELCISMIHHSFVTT